MLQVGSSVGMTAVGIATDVVGVGAIVAIGIDGGVGVEVAVPARIGISGLIFGQNQLGE